MSALPIQHDPFIANAARHLTELAGELSAQEHAFAPEANADRYAIERRVRKDLAAQVLRRELEAMPWDALRVDNTRGDVAAKLYATWAPHNEAEPIVETTYATKALRMDLTTAMALHGRPEAFREACRILGESITMAAIDYVLSCHDTEAEEAEASLRSDGARREAAREEAADLEFERRRELSREERR